MNEPLTSERANNILGLFEIGKDESMVFVEDGYDYLHTILVGDEFNRLRGEIEEKVKTAKSEKELLGLVKSDMLDVKKVLSVVKRRAFPEEYFVTFQMLKNEWV